MSYYRRARAIWLATATQKDPAHGIEALVGLRRAASNAGLRRQLLHPPPLFPSGSDPVWPAWMSPVARSCRCALQPRAASPCESRRYRSRSERVRDRERGFHWHLFHRLGDSIKKTFGRSSDESKDKRGHRGNEPDANLGRISRLGVKVMVRQDGAQPIPNRS